MYYYAEFFYLLHKIKKIKIVEFLFLYALYIHFYLFFVLN